jgi:hypothetical protein
VIPNKNAETVADTIFKEWFCKKLSFGRIIPTTQYIAYKNITSPSAE